MISGKEKKRRSNATMGTRCPACAKMVRTRTKAEKLALSLRSGIRRLSARRKGYDRTHAYECPEGYGWHVGRQKKGRDL